MKHLGNIIGSILPADIFHRFLDIFGVDNVYICGTDEHGTAVELAALEEGLTPEKYSAKYYEIQKKIYEKWNFDFTFFGRSSSQSNHELTQGIFLSSLENGYIKEDAITVPYCRHDKRFLPDRYITGICPVCGYESARGDQCEKCSTVLDPEQLRNPRCTICKKQEIEFRSEKHLFLNLPLLEEKLKEWVLQQTHWPDNTRNLALGWLREGLKQRCITRNLKWGVQVPKKGYEHLRFYVWYDANNAYISITKDAHEAGIIKDWKSYWKDSRLYQFMGKDNVPSHADFRPAIALAARDSEERDTNFLLPHHVAGYEYLNWEGEKFSTSKGVGLFSDEALELFPADYWRFYLASILPESKDSNFDWTDFQNRINGELIANYGNLFYRATYFIEKNFGGKLPEGTLGEEERNLQWSLGQTISKVQELVKEVKLREALKETLAFASLVNKYFQDSKPWETVNSDREKAATTLYTTANLLRPISILLSPYIPTSAAKALECLGGSGRLKAHELTDKFLIESGQKIKAEILFKKIEDKEIESAKRHRTKYAKSERKNHDSSHDSLKLVNGMLPAEEFKKADLRVATITGVRDHPNADKLYLTDIDLGTEKRTIVTGLKFKYTKEQLTGKQVIVITNLQPKQFRGIESRGMLLAAEDGTLIEPGSKVPNGSKIM